MRESLQRRCGPWRSVCLRPQASTDPSLRRVNSSIVVQPPRTIWRLGIALVTAVLVAPAVALAQSPWERAAINLERTFTGPLARSLALVSIVIGGLMFMFGEAGAKRQISGIVFGGGLALFATQFLAWLF